MNFVFFKSPMKMGLFSFALTFIFSLTGFAQSDLVARAKAERWSERREWHRLLQYQRKLFGGFESPAEPGPFFVDPEGKTNPEAELIATITALLNTDIKIKSQDGKFAEPAVCVFPARKMWLEKISGTTFPRSACDRYDRFLEILAPQSFTYVFSSYYLNNPASAYGHTFLRINKAPSSRDGERYELSDYGVGYAAMKVSENPLVYSFLGLSGLMPGTFDINPYYFKVREYNDFESRDLWEYDLDLNPVEVQMAVAYIWELLGAHFNYHYMSENCAYRILSIFEVARPDLELINKLKTQVMPADTVATLYQVPGFVTKIHYRPSVRSIFLSRYEKLSEPAKKRIVEFSRTEVPSTLTENLSPDQQREALDAAMDYLDYRYPTEILTKKGKYALKKEVLSTRAETGGLSELLKATPPWKEAPHDAQGSRRWGLGVREWNKQKSYLLEMKLSLHDLLDPKLGYPPTAEITMGSFTGSYTPDTKEFALDRALLYEVISLSPVDDFNRGPSWRLKVALERGFENGCATICRWTELSGGSAYTKTFFQNLDVSIWMRASGQTSNDFQSDSWRMGLGPSIMVRWNKDWFSLIGESYYRYDYRGPHQEYRINTLGMNLSFNKSWGLRLQGEDSQSRQRLDGKLLWYY